jgi:hypothetical protein
VTGRLGIRTGRIAHIGLYRDFLAFHYRPPILNTAVPPLTSRMKPRTFSTLKYWPQSNCLWPGSYPCLSTCPYIAIAPSLFSQGHRGIPSRTLRRCPAWTTPLTDTTYQCRPARGIAHPCRMSMIDRRLGLPIGAAVSALSLLSITRKGRFARTVA